MMDVSIVNGSTNSDLRNPYLVQWLNLSSHGLNIGRLKPPLTKVYR